MTEFHRGAGRRTRRHGRRAAAPFGRKRVAAAALPTGVLLVLALSGCEGPMDRAAPAAPGAGTAGAGLSAAGLEGAAAGPDAQRAAELARGELLSFACRACHGLAPGDPSPLGPPLDGVFGRPAASVPGFDYSPVLQQSGIVWTPETLDAWLTRPDQFLPGNNMAFTGFRSAEDRRALIAYLEQATAAAP